MFSSFSSILFLIYFGSSTDVTVASISRSYKIIDISGGTKSSAYLMPRIDFLKFDRSMKV